MSSERWAAELEDRLQALLEDVRRLRGWTRELEAENLRLRSALLQAGTEAMVSAGIEAAAVVPGNSGRAVLERLYREEFHVCPYNFGQSRTEGCLFCAEFLRRLESAENFGS